MSLFPASGGGKETYLVVQKNYSGTFTDVAAGGVATYSIDVTESGYKPIGILGYGYAQSGTETFALVSMYIDTATLTTGSIKIKNVSSATAKPYLVYMIVCYVKV